MMVNYWNPNRFSSILHCGLVVGPCSLWQTLLGGKNQSLTQMDARKLKAMQRQQPKKGNQAQNFTWERSTSTEEEAAAP